ncbi:WGR domain-containing protein [Maritalea sp.]|uniref:WGR domain-containing protein n=1 Tax=Maritalea sp. TaxID=2003361 RepID=UPI003EF24708
MNCLLNVSQARLGITLYHDDVSSNKARFYHMTLSMGLWGNQIVERQWGRRGTWGQFRLDCFDNLEVALDAMQEICRSKLARGYSLDVGVDNTKIELIDRTLP